MSSWRVVCLRMDGDAMVQGDGTMTSWVAGKGWSTRSPMWQGTADILSVEAGVNSTGAVAKDQELEILSETFTSLILCMIGFCCLLGNCSLDSTHRVQCFSPSGREQERR